MDSVIFDLFLKQTDLMGQMNSIISKEQVPAPAPKKAENVGGGKLDSRSVAAVVIGLISRLTAYDRDEIDLGSDIIRELGFDSIMLSKLIVEILDEYPVLNQRGQAIMASLQGKSITVGQIVNTLLKELSIDDQVEASEFSPSKNDAGTARTSHTVLDKSLYIFTESAEYQQLLERKHLIGDNNPYFKVSSGMPRDVMTIEGKDYINFTTYNYVGLNGRPEVIDAVKEAIEKYGTSVSGSRLLSGEIPLHKELENEISDFLGTEDTIVYVGGHTTNVNAIGHFVSQNDLIIHDSLSHNSIIEGCLLSGAARRPFVHNDIEDLERILQKIRSKFNKVLIIVEGIYSMDGDICPLKELIEIKKKYQAFLMIDEAHSVGTIGNCGRGVGDYFDIDRRDVDLWMGTLSKSLASCGGYISGSKELIEYLKYYSPGFIFSCGITPSNTAAALAALKVLKSEPELTERLKENSKLFLKLAREAGFDTGSSQDTPIIPIMIGDSVTAMMLTRKLFERGINVMPIVYPAVPEDMVRFRFFMSSLHTQEQIESTINILKEELLEIG